MRNLKVFLVIFIFTASVMAQSESNKVKIQQKIQSVLDTQTAAWNSGDLEAFMDGYWKSDKMIFISGNRVSKGWQQALDNYKKGYKTREDMGTLTFSELEIKVLSKNSALVIGRFTLVREKDKLTGMFTLTFQRFGKYWRIIVDHTS
ncbi:MAG: YybH family protein [Pyrinomonadaceae bacterium]